MCPVDPVCHQLTCHRRLFSLSRTRSRRFIALFMSIDFAISATPTSQCTLFTYLWYVWRHSWRCAKYSNSDLGHALEGCYSLSTTAAISSPCAALSSPSILKNCWVALLRSGLGLGLALELRLQLGLGSVLVYTLKVRLGVTVSHQSWKERVIAHLCEKSKLDYSAHLH